MRGDLLSAYVAAGAKILSWVVVGGLVYRVAGAGAFALLALIRGTLGLLNYVSFGLSPAIIHLLPIAEQEDRETEAKSATPDVGVLVYESVRAGAVQTLYANAAAVALASALLGCVAIITYTILIARLGLVPQERAFRDEANMAVGLMGLGVLLRLMSDVPGAINQVRGRIVWDNLAVAAGEALWAVVSCVGLLGPHSASKEVMEVAGAHFWSGFVILALRGGRAFHGHLRVPRWALLNGASLRKLFGFGLFVTLAQLADFLYAPVDYLLIARLLGPRQVAVYAPAVQIDAGLILLVVGLASVLLPKTSVAKAAGDMGLIRRYYVRGTLASAGMLAAGAVAVYLASPWIFRLWFGTPMEGTRAILPWVLVHTVVGGSSAVGRSVLLGMGKVKAYTAAALAAGVANVVLSYIFVRYGGMGLKGIILGTIVVVVARCAVWMPWYVMGSLRRSQGEAVQLERVNT